MTIDQLIAYITASRQHNLLYHFTDESNFPTIAQKGLLSKAKMREEGWWPVVTGGNQLSHDLDQSRGISSYVSLCFTRNHPMKYLAHQQGRLPTPRYLGISPELLSLQGVRVAFGVANANETQILDLPQAIAQMDLEVVYSRTDWRDAEIQRRLKAAEKMELLIPHHVPLHMILSVF